MKALISIGMAVVLATGTQIFSVSAAEPEVPLKSAPLRQNWAIMDQMHCKEAAWMLQEIGWRNIKMVKCGGIIYVLQAQRRDKVWQILVNSYLYRVVGMRQIK